MVATFKATPKRRMSRNITSRAKTDGTMAMSRAAPLLNTRKKVEKITAAVKAKLSTRVGTRWAPIFSARRPWPTMRTWLFASRGSPCPASVHRR